MLPDLSHDTVVHAGCVGHQAVRLTERAGSVAPLRVGISVDGGADEHVAHGIGGPAAGPGAHDIAERDAHTPIEQRARKLPSVLPVGRLAVSAREREQRVIPPRFGLGLFDRNAKPERQRVGLPRQVVEPHGSCGGGRVGLEARLEPALNPIHGSAPRSPARRTGTRPRHP